MSNLEYLNLQKFFQANQDSRKSLSVSKIGMMKRKAYASRQRFIRVESNLPLSLNPFTTLEDHPNSILLRSQVFPWALNKFVFYHI